MSQTVLEPNCPKNAFRKTLNHCSIILMPELRKNFLSICIMDSRTDLKQKLSRILDMTSFGDWLMLYMIAKNVDKLTFTELLDWLKYPDYHWNLDENDEENQFLDNLQFEQKSA